MNKYINRFMVLAGMGLALAACSENDWNDKLDGFEVPDKNPSETVTFTMNDVDFAQLAKSEAALKYAGDYADEFAAMCAQGAFTPQFPAETYLPFFLAQPTCPYFSLPEGSAIKVTYRTTEQQAPQQVGAINAKQYTVTEEDYQGVWGSDTDYAEAFAPSKPASRNLPAILKTAYAQADSGDYVIVTYKVSAQDPVFGGSAPEQPKFELSNVIASSAYGASVTINGYVSCLTTMGFVLTDASGSIFVYCKNTSFSDLAVGTQITLEGTVSCNNYGKQINDGSTITVMGKQEVTYPTATALTATYMENLKKDIDVLYDADKNSGKTTIKIDPFYASMTGTIAISGTNINIIVDGADNTQGSFYGLPSDLKSQLADGDKVTVYGYFMAVAGRRYFNMATTSIEKANSKAARESTAAADSRAVILASETEQAIYWFDGTKWASPSDMYVLTHADYQSMGLSYDNLSNNGPELYLPTLLNNKYPYAQEGEIRYLVYSYYNGTSNVTRCDECVYTGGQWQVGYGSTSYVTSQFVKKGGVWKYSPDVVITLPAGRNVEISTLYYQACVDWVLANVEGGANYVTKYGNNDYYTGASAYQGNVDLRPDKARDQYAEGYAGMSDDEIIALEKKRLVEEVFPGVLHELHGDAAPTNSGVQPYYTINFYYYTGSATLPAQAVYQVVAKGTFKFVSQNWGK